MEKRSGRHELLMRRAQPGGKGRSIEASAGLFNDAIDVGAWMNDHLARRATSLRLLQSVAATRQ
ncbi:MAG: hypothetical protein WKG00_35485 [Polyangiaceae bacterium]